MSIYSQWVLLTSVFTVGRAYWSWSLRRTYLLLIRSTPPEGLAAVTADAFTDNRVSHETPWTTSGHISIPTKRHNWLFANHGGSSLFSLRHMRTYYHIPLIVIQLVALEYSNILPAIYGFITLCQRCLGYQDVSTYSRGIILNWQYGSLSPSFIRRISLHEYTVFLSAFINIPTRRRSVYEHTQRVSSRYISIFL